MILLDLQVILIALAGPAFCARGRASNSSTASNSSLSSNSSIRISNTETSLTLLYQNNLNLTDDGNHAATIMLDAMPHGDAEAACAAINETLLLRSTIAAHYTDFLPMLSYQAFMRRMDPLQMYSVENGVLAVFESLQQVTFPINDSVPATMPVLCSESSGGSNASNANNARAKATEGNKILVQSSGNTYVGFRNQKSFRFLGVRYAEPPKRFEYPVPVSTKGQVIDSFEYGSQCIQTGSGGSEDCLFLNIQTPYIPKVGSNINLRPVLIWIHGGGFTGGSGSAGDIDGGQLASREDIVTVNINYRLSTLGFLALPGTNITGNFGIADQSMAIQWVVDNIANFGGDPKRITLNGESAGACSVRVHLGSPEAIGKFKGAIAMSNLGGGQDLGLEGNYATQYSNYPTIEESFNLSSNLFNELSCNQTDNAGKVDCLRGLDAGAIINATTVARYVVQDGKYVVTPELVMSRPNVNTAHVPVIFGITANDGASFSTYPKAVVSTQVEGIQQTLGITAEMAQSVIDSKLFPLFDTGNITLDAFNVSQRVATDNQFRCVDQASAFAGAATGAFPAAWYYENQRTASPPSAGYDPNLLGGPPVTEGFPDGNPNLPYFRLHGSDQSWQFGFLSKIRAPEDLFSVQMSVAYFSEFIRSGQPNPNLAYLKVRGYDNIAQAMVATGPWQPVSGLEGPIRILDWPGRNDRFVDVEQCAFLNYSITHLTETRK